MRNDLELVLLYIRAKKASLNRFKKLSLKKDIYNMCQEYGYKKTFEIFNKELEEILKKFLNKPEKLKFNLDNLSGGNSKYSYKIASGLLLPLTLLNPEITNAKTICSSANSIVTSKSSAEKVNHILSEENKSWWNNLSSEERSSLIGAGGVMGISAIGLGSFIMYNMIQERNSKYYKEFFLREIEAIREEVKDCSPNEKSRLFRIEERFNTALSKFVKNKYSLNNLSLKLNKLSSMDNFVEDVILKLKNIVKYFKYCSDFEIADKLNNEVINWNDIAKNWKEKCSKYYYTIGTIGEIEKVLSSIEKIINESKAEEKYLDESELPKSSYIKKDLEEIVKNGEKLAKGKSDFEITSMLEEIYEKFGNLLEVARLKMNIFKDIAGSDLEDLPDLPESAINKQILLNMPGGYEVYYILDLNQKSIKFIDTVSKSKCETYSLINLNYNEKNSEATLSKLSSILNDLEELNTLPAYFFNVIFDINE